MTAVNEAAEPATVRESPALQPPPGNPRFPLLDPLRAIAILLVVAFHAAGTAGLQSGAAADLAGQGFSGVMIFFALSGFLIYRPFVAAREEGRPAPRLLRFWRRRAFRILPAYWAALTAFAVVGAIDDVFTVRAPVYYLFGQIYSAQTFGNGITVAWSLCVEMSFYALLPAWAWLIARAGPRWPRAEAIGLSAVVAFSLAWRGAVRAGWLPEVWASALPGMATYFAVGMALAALSVRLHHQQGSRLVRLVRDHPDLVWAGALAAYLAAAVAFSVSNYATAARSWSAWYGNYLLCAVLAALLLAPAIFGQEGGGVSRWLMRRPALAWVGLVSYGIFLWHLPPLVKLHAHVGSAALLFAAALVVATAVAAVSYYALELPLLRLKEPRPRQRA